MLLYVILMVQLGGPSWTVPLGRRDATTASASLANSDLPGPTSNLNGLLNAFSNKGFSTTDMVALSGTCTDHISFFLHHMQRHGIDSQ